MITVKIFLRNRENKEGKRAVTLRIIVDRVPAEEILCYVKDKHWKDADERVLHNDPNATVYNTLIKTRRKQVQTLIDAHQDAGDTFSGRALLNINYRQWEDQRSRTAEVVPQSFMAHARLLIDSRRRNRQLTTAQRYTSYYETLADYLTLTGKTDLLFWELTDLFLDTFFQHLRNKVYKPNGENTLHRRFGWIKTVVRDAQDAGLITQKPFRRFKTRAIKVKKTKLRPDEILRLENLPADAEIYEQKAVCIFLMQLYAYGSRISDILTLTNGNIHPQPGGRWLLEFKQRKTGTLMSIELPPKGQSLYAKFYRPERPTDFVVNWLQWEADPLLDEAENEQMLEREIQSKTTMVNAGLKKAGQRVGLAAKLTSHVARHSWAMAAKRSKVDIHAISQALGHSSINQTAVYLDDLDADEVHQAVRNVLG